MGRWQCRGDFNLGALRDDGYRSADTVRLVNEVIAEQNPIALPGIRDAENVEAIIKVELLETSGMPVVGVRSGVETF